MVDSFSRIIRLGEGISATGSISEAAIERAIAALSICRDKIRYRKAQTPAADRDRSLPRGRQCRSLPRRVAAETGIRLEVIDRETEATLAVIGCSPLLDPKGRGAILFDIGGGSTELVRIERDPDEQDAPPRIKAWMSIPLGVVTLAEHFGGRDVTRAILCADGARRSRNMWRRSPPSTARILRDMHMLGTSGTVTTLAGVHLNLARYDRRRIDGIWMSDADITATIQRLLGMSYQERADNNCISVERADLVLAGCAILDAIREAFPLPRLRVADRGLREGMLVEMMREDGALRASRRWRDCWSLRCEVTRSRRRIRIFEGPARHDMAKDTTGRLHVTVKSGGKRKLSSKLWLERQLNDPYVAQAKRDGYRSRAAYKLIEIDDKHHFLKPGITVVDLGAAPGGWSQIAAKRVGAVSGKGKVVAIDLLEMPEIPGVSFAQLDFLAEDAPEKLLAMMGGRADVVMSDMAANTTGHRKTDQLRIVGLVETAAAFASDVLNPGGTFLAKVFQSGADAELVAQLKRDFASVGMSSRPRAGRIPPSAMCWRWDFGASALGGNPDWMGASDATQPSR